MSSHKLPSGDLYALLGVERDATKRQIKLAFLKHALENHPDKAGNTRQATETFVKIREAYDILSDSKMRQEYDAQREPETSNAESYPSGEQLSAQSAASNSTSSDKETPSAVLKRFRQYEEDYLSEAEELDTAVVANVRKISQYILRSEKEVWGEVAEVCEKVQRLKDDLQLVGSFIGNMKTEAHVRWLQTGLQSEPASVILRLSIEET
ncbi:DnaJ domain-containing protein [Whalleya microplaca]|nr:DnaJ domain-containing protein [Whalleya microplaca]